MAYDKKFRETVLKYIDKGHSIREAHEVFEVGTTTIKKLFRRRRNPPHDHTACRKQAVDNHAGT